MTIEYNIGDWKTPETIAHGLTATGRPVKGPNAEGLYETTTAICHNGDSHQRDGSLKLWFRPDGNGGTQAGCNSAGCGEGRDGQRELLDKLRAAAGVERPRRGSTPTVYGDKLAAITALYAGAFTSSEDGLTRATCPACLQHGTLTIRTFDGWPLLACECGASYRELYVPLTETRFTAWAEYQLVDGPRRKLRVEQRKNPKIWAKEPDGRTRRTAGAQVKLWGNHHAGNSLLYCEGEMAAAAMVSAGLNERGYTPVTWAGGANKGVRQSISGMSHWPAKDAHVVLWPDNDEEGQGRKAMVAGAVAVQNAGALSVRMVDVTTMAMKADAADIPVAEIFERLDSAALYEAPVEPTNYSGGLTVDELSVPGDCARLLMNCAHQLLVVNHVNGMHEQGMPDLYVLTEGGVWSNRPSVLQHWYDKAQKEWLQKVDSSDTSDERKQRVYKHVLQTCKPAGRQAAIEYLSATLGRLEAEGFSEQLEPLTRCRFRELNADPRYLGTPSGVIDLRDGRLLTPEEGRRKKITASIADPYDPEATHPDVQKLTAHYDEETAEYVWAELAYSMRGTPNDRLVLMDSATGRGKTTLMKAVTAAIGDYGSKAHRSVIAMDDKRNAGQANPAMFALTSPARVCYIEEVGNVTFDLDKAKNIASGGTEKVRGMRENWKDAEITATLWMLRNPPPPGARQTLGLHDSAMVRRLRLITVPPLAASAEVDLFANGFTAATSEGRRRRQALVAKLVKLATNSRKPAMPNDLATAMDDARQAEVGIGGGWLRTALEHVRGERVSTAAIWSAYCAAMGQPEADGRTKVESFTRDSMLAEIRRIYTPGPVKHLWIEGKTQRGLDGWTLTDQSLKTAADELDAGLAAC